MLADFVNLFFECAARVLILVLLEYARRHRKDANKDNGLYGLNPCFTGICSPTSNKCAFNFTGEVLILVLLEYARRHLCRCLKHQYEKS